MELQNLAFRKLAQVAQIGGTILLLSDCSSVRNALGLDDDKWVPPISNPFYTYRPNSKNEAPPMILRTKKGDRSVEVELPSSTKDLSEFVVPLSPAFRDSLRRPASISGEDGSGVTPDDSYKNRPATSADHEITGSFAQGSAEDQAKRSEIEQNLHLAPNDDDTPTEGTPSYLAATDYIKQLYRSNRFEAALLETDDLIRQFPTDPRLYEMRGTLLDRLGRRELAIKSWSQALRLSPQNDHLRKFLDRKQGRSTAGAK